MNISEENAEQFNSFLSWLMEAAQSGATEMAEQSQLLLQEIAFVGAIQNWTYTVIFIAFMILSIFLWKNKRKAFDSDDCPTAWGFLCISITVVTVLLFVGTLKEFLPNALKATFAPRLYTLEYLADLI